eukprot:CAMPEP_0172541374 /NCGR_PEP_ID=MMETSP1067-20121228/12203_1 /TAXON_ID=265564 ORGANISM="Thalassiosira punctigera, Strain Tpunct2005C2" /NCGR_SAMPLE_ID=MMETSP1067 /ASSEMBLY_ACC=CAM_ASM_000444 /LENGTH=66 /DNA_ID=CAMNT_0013327403 /DNA_START=283 /DNA_END=483 /DNA_ORIENTATION=-
MTVAGGEIAQAPSVHELQHKRDAVALAAIIIEKGPLQHHETVAVEGAQQFQFADEHGPSGGIAEGE